MQAFKKYVQSIFAWKSIKDFEQSFNEDRKHLSRNGIRETDMNLMLDYLKLQVRSKQSPKK